MIFIKNLLSEGEFFMKISLLDLQVEYNSIKGDLEPLVLSTMASGQYIMGQAVEKLEEELKNYLHVNYAITVANGTDALVIALTALGIGEGDEVITTPFTFFATAESIAKVGAEPVFVDVLEDTFNINPAQIEEKITAKTKAILPVHIFGQPAQMDEINAIAQKHGLSVIEDACQAIGAKYKGRMAGGLGDIACFSFFPTKNLGCFGDGGLITTNSEKLATVCRALREHGGGKAGREAYHLLAETKITETDAIIPEGEVYNALKYSNYLIGYNSRLDALQAVILSVKLKKLDEWNKLRVAHAHFYNERLKAEKLKTPFIHKDVDMVYHQYVLKSIERDKLTACLTENGVSTGAYYPIPLHLQKAFAYLQYKKGDLPVSEYLSTQTFALPIYPELNLEQKEYITELINSYLDK